MAGVEEGREKTFEMFSLGERKNGVGRPFYLLNFSVSKETQQKDNAEEEESAREEERGGRMDGGCFVWGKGGLQPPHPKPCFFNSSFLSEWREFYCIYIPIYRYRSGQRRVYIYIYPLHRQLLWKERETDSCLSLVQEERLVVLVTNGYAAPPSVQTAQKPVGVCACWPWPPEEAPCWAAFCFSMVQSNVQSYWWFRVLKRMRNSWRRYM